MKVIPNPSENVTKTYFLIQNIPLSICSMFKNEYISLKRGYMDYYRLLVYKNKSYLLSAKSKNVKQF